jgi:GPH family glycoside/pentoside/hexuronide:cation symporter
MSEEAKSSTLPARQKIGWGIGGAAEAWMASGINQFAGPIYTIALKLDPAKLGLIGSVPRFLDAAYDIWLGNLSDNTRTRWGRRRPFIAIGTVLCAIFFVAVGWVPLGHTANFQLGYFAFASMGYWLAFGTYAIPFNALGFELTNDYNERTSVQAHRFFCIQLSGLALSALYPLCFAHVFTRHVPQGIAPEVIGARWVSLIFGGLILIAGLTPALVSRENLINEAHPRVPLMAALRLTFTDRLFLHFIAMIIISITGVTIASSLGLYITIYHVFAGDRQSASRLMFTTSVVISICTLALTTVLPRIARGLGKKGLILCGEAMMALGGLVTWKFYTPLHPYWLIIPAFTSTAGLACFQILYGSFLGDICDADEVRSGSRREGMYGAAATFLNKLVYASQGALSGIILTLTGYSATHTVQTPGALLRMRAVFAIAPGLFAMIGAVLAVTYPITAKVAAETRRLLEARHTAEHLEDTVVPAIRAGISPPEPEV